MTDRKATISDVAKRARVSVGTVSHVLTGHVPVAGERRDRVMRAIEALGYVPNVHAQGLRQSTSNVVGLCFPHESTSYLNDLSEALERVATQAGYGILHVFSRHDPAIEVRRVRELMRYQVDGLILFPSAAPEKALDLALDQRMPTVLVDRPSDDARFDLAMIDNRKVTREAMRRLIALGHRRFAFVCRSRQLLVTQHRVDALRAAQRAAPATVALVTFEIATDEARFVRELAACMTGADAPTAIIASNSHQASLILTLLRDCNLGVPAQVSVLTFDDPEWAKLVAPSLSVIRQPATALAQATWDLLMRRIAHPDRPPARVALEPTIEFRGSVAAPPAAVAGKSRGPVGRRPSRA